jgi:hypothetical protein
MSWLSLFKLFFIIKIQKTYIGKQFLNNMAVPSRRNRASHNKQLMKDKKFRDEMAKREKEEQKEKNPEDVKNLFESIAEMKKKIKKDKQNSKTI